MVAVVQPGEMRVARLQRIDRIVHVRKFVVKVVVFDMHVGLPLRLFRLEQRQILGFYAIFPGMRGVLTTTSAHCARWRRA